MKAKFFKNVFLITLQILLICIAASNAQVFRCPRPGQPGSITATGGNTKVCPSDIKTYTVGISTGATGYKWIPPVGGIIISGQGSRSVTISYTSGFVASDSLKVTGTNSCGPGPASTIFIIRNSIPNPTGPFNGPSNRLLRKIGQLTKGV